MKPYKILQQNFAQILKISLPSVEIPCVSYHIYHTYIIRHCHIYLCICECYPSYITLRICLVNVVELPKVNEHASWNDRNHTT